MDHFPTNWGRPVSEKTLSTHFYIFKLIGKSFLFFSEKRNDAFDAYGTYPIAQRPQKNGPKDAFSLGVQRTQ